MNRKLLREDIKGWETINPSELKQAGQRQGLRTKPSLKKDTEGHG